MTKKVNDILDFSTNRKITFKDFFKWCEENNLKNNKQIAEAFCKTTQTVRNWQKEDQNKELPLWLKYACYANIKLKFDHSSLKKINVSGFSDFQDEFSLHTYEKVADLLRISRQAVFNWVDRNKFPEYLKLFIYGYKEVKKEKDKKKS